MEGSLNFKKAVLTGGIAAGSNYFGFSGFQDEFGNNSVLKSGMVAAGQTVATSMVVGMLGYDEDDHDNSNLLVSSVIAGGLNVLAAKYIGDPDSMARNFFEGALINAAGDTVYGMLQDRGGAIGMLQSATGVHLMGP